MRWEVRSAGLVLLTLAGCGGAAREGAGAATPPRTTTSAFADGHVDPETREGEATAEEGCDEPPDGTDDDGDDDEHSTLDDGMEAPMVPDAAARATPPPFADLADAAIEARLRADIASLGSMSIGRTNGGALVAGVRMPAGEHWELVSPGLAWGTQETVDALAHAIDAVAARFPDTPKAFVGNISTKNGGHFHPHVSHQSGRDVDLGYYLTEGHRWYATANGSNLDRPRTWHLVRTLIADSDIDLILVDRQIQKLLKAYALGIGEDPAWLDDVFQVGGKSPRPLIFHAKGHASHLHIRFYNPMAQELGRRAYRHLVARGKITPPTLYVTHTVKPGETLSHLARKYKVTTDAIKKANALKRDLLRVNKPYKIRSAAASRSPRASPSRRGASAGAEPPRRRPSNGKTCRRASAP